MKLLKIIMNVKFEPDQQARKLINEFKAGKNPTSMVYINGKDGFKPCKINIEYECLGDIIVGEYCHSIFTKFLDPEDLERFIAIEQEAENSLPKDIEFKSMLKEDKMFVKLPFKGDKYSFIFDPPVFPNNLEKSCLHTGSFVDIEFQPNIWINFEKRQAGLFLKIFTITVDGGKKKQRSR